VTGDQHCIFGRTGETVPPVWLDRGNGLIEAGDWRVLRIGPEALDRRGDQLVAAQLATLNLKSIDLVIATGITGNDFKSGWPMHGLQRLRDLKLTRYFALETADPLEAEWIAGHTPVHAIVVPYHARDMAVRYRVFDVATTTGVAILSPAHTADEWALHRATKEICATILPAGHQFDRIAGPPAVARDLLWQHYQAAHPEPPKLRGAHPPETGA
jgi:hypothetical protein